MAFNFNQDNTFSENLTSFYDEVKEIDNEMAEILIEHAGELEKIVSDGERNLRNRSRFNALVKSSLFELIDNDSAEGED